MIKSVNKIIPIVVFPLAFIYFFPILWLVLAGFKYEVDVVNPSLFFHPTLSHYRVILNGPIFQHLLNSILVSTLSTAIALLFGIPTSYAIVRYLSEKKGNNIFFWFVSTIILPPACVVIPLYIVFNKMNILDTYFGLILIYSAINIPIAVWMMRSFFKDIPVELIEAARLDGASELLSFIYIVLPLARHGISATILLILIFAWNEFFFALHLTNTNATTLPIHMLTYMTQEGLFWAKMSAISTIAILPPIVLGWINQKQLVRGLTMGAVKA